MAGDIQPPDALRRSHADVPQTLQDLQAITQLD
jgi:hypothetical protein